MTTSVIASLTPAQVVRVFGDAEVHDLDRAALIDLIEAAEAVKSAAAAAQARATMELLHAEKAARPRWRPEQIARTVASMVALARRDSPRKGSDHVSLAKSLTEALPETLQLMSDGMLSERRAASISNETRHLSTADRQEVDHEIASRLTGAGDRKVRDLARATADRIDPDGAERRVRRARKASFVATYTEPDGTARVTARMPFEQAMAVQRSLTTAAQEALKSRDESRRIGEVMADLLAERVLGSASPVLNLEVQLVMNERTLLRGSDEPAYVAGYGPIPGFLSRSLVHDATKVWIRRLYTAPETGELMAMESKRRTFPAGMRRAIVARDRTCRNPFCNAEIKHIDHRRPWAKRRTTELGNGDGLCERCNYVKTELGLHVDIINPKKGLLRVVTPDGHSFKAEGTPLPGTGATTPTDMLRQILDDRRHMRGTEGPESA